MVSIKICLKYFCISQFLGCSCIIIGICFPMGKGMYRVIHIPEDEAVLLNSREKAPFLICVEVLKVEAPRYFCAANSNWHVILIYNGCKRIFINNKFQKYLFMLFLKFVPFGKSSVYKLFGHCLPNLIWHVAI